MGRAAKNAEDTIKLKKPRQSPRRKTWFLNEDLVRVEHVSRAQGIVTLYNCNQDRFMTVDILEFKRKRKRAYFISEAARLLNYHEKSIPRLVKRGYLPEPVGELPGGKREFHRMSYYSEDHIFEARKLMAQQHIGRTRKDGLVTNNKTPTAQELRYAMGDGLLYYVRDDEGRFIPTFAETI